MDQHPEIDILLATYNGGRFIEEQIRSLLGQTYSHWRLIIRDDGSTDNTREIIGRFKEKYPEKIIVIQDNLTNLGACRNFGRLLEHSTADYAMFCDQDDVWLPKKIELTMSKMRSLEERCGNNRPLLVYTDMYVVNDGLSVISDSFWRHQVFNPRIGKSLSRFLVSNVATGCTVMLNKKLREMAVPFPNDVLMHDWWVGLISVALGDNDYIDQPTMFYRQHEMNVAGAKWDASISALFRKILNFKHLNQANKAHLLRTQRQAGMFAARYKDQLKIEDYQKMVVYANMASKNFFKKRVYIIKYGFWWSGLMRSVVLFLTI